MAEDVRREAEPDMGDTGMVFGKQVSYRAVFQNQTRPQTQAAGR